MKILENDSDLKLINDYVEHTEYITHENWFDRKSKLFMLISLEIFCYLLFLVFIYITYEVNIIFSTINLDQAKLSSLEEVFLRIRFSYLLIGFIMFVPAVLCRKLRKQLRKIENINSNSKMVLKAINKK